MPKISVIMGVYNTEKYLKEAIESILSQSLQDFEFIICDDGSLDGSVSIINDYMKKDPRIILIRNDKNRGLAASLNRCLEVASGEYIARMDSDDISVEDRFMKQANFLDLHPEYAIIGGGISLFDHKGIYGHRYGKEDFSKEQVFIGNFFIHPTVMMRRSVLIDVGGYTVDKHTYRTEDYDLWCKIAYHGYKGTNLKDILLLYREGRDSYSKRKFKYRIDGARLRYKWFKKFNLPLRYWPYILKPIFVGLIPKGIVQNYHRKKYSI